jgi:hypothetical protein
MTQVDLGLTGVWLGLTRLIWSLALMTVIKNLGRHTSTVRFGELVFKSLLDFINFFSYFILHNSQIRILASDF